VLAGWRVVRGLVGLEGSKPDSDSGSDCGSDSEVVSHLRFAVHYLRQPRPCHTRLLMPVQASTA
jgi:hypothetical protein